MEMNLVTDDREEMSAEEKEEMSMWAQDRIVARDYLRGLDDIEKLSSNGLGILLQIYYWFEQDSSFEASLIKIQSVRLYEHFKQKTPQEEKSMSDAA